MSIRAHSVIFNVNYFFINGTSVIWVLGKTPTRKYLIRKRREAREKNFLSANSRQKVILRLPSRICEKSS